MPLLFILDDDVDLLASQRMLLESKGYRVASADAMDAALTMIAERRPDLILVDLMMEHYDSGFIFCRKVREIEGLAGTPIIMQTAASRKIGFTVSANTARDREWTKVDEILTKPVALDHLLARIAYHLGESG